MKRLLLIFVLALLTVGSNAQTKEFKVTVKITNYPKEVIYLGAIIGEDITRVPLQLKDGFGETSMKLPLYTSVVVISTDPSNNIPSGLGIIPGPSLSFYVDGKDVAFEIDYSKWPLANIKGGKTNNELGILFGKTNLLKNKEFTLRRQLVSLENQSLDKSPKHFEISEDISKIKNDIQKIEEQFVLDYPSSYVSMMLLNGQKNSFGIDEFERRYNLLSADIKNTIVGKELSSYIKTTYATAKGMSAPTFVKKDKDGKSVSLADYKGKYLLIDFWGTWCIPCRNSHPHLLGLYEKYNKLGLEFINVAQESSVRSRDLWLKAIAEDKLVWTQILNNEKIEQYDIVKLFGITAFPTKILINKEGKIVGRFVGDSEEIDALLKDIFKQ